MAPGVERTHEGTLETRRRAVQSKSRVGSRCYRDKMLGKNLLFYFVAGTVIALVAQALGANLGIVIFASMIGPPIIHLAALLLR